MFYCYAIQCTLIVRYKPISSSLICPCGARPFAFVNLAINDSFRIQPTTNDLISVEDKLINVSYCLEVEMLHINTAP